jgi:hypothetical protein
MAHLRYRGHPPGRALVVRLSCAQCAAGVEALGVLELYRCTASSLTEKHHAAAQAGAAHAEPLTRTQIHVAAGILAIQLNTSPMRRWTDCGLTPTPVAVASPLWPPTSSPVDSP